MKTTQRAWLVRKVTAGRGRHCSSLYEQLKATGNSHPQIKINKPTAAFDAGNADIVSRLLQIPHCSSLYEQLQIPGLDIDYQDQGYLGFTAAQRAVGYLARRYLINGLIIIILSFLTG